MSRSDRTSVSVLRLLAVALLVLVLTVIYGAYRSFLILPKTYIATAQIEELSPGPNPSARSDMQMMRTGEFLVPIIVDLELDKIWAARDGRKVEALPPQDALIHLNEFLYLETAPGTNVIVVKVGSNISKEAADIANAIVDRFQVLRSVEADQRLRRARDALAGQISAQQKVIGEKKADLEKIRADLGQKGIVIAPGVAGLIEADLAARKLDAAAGSQQTASALEPMRDLQRQIDQQQSVLDDLNVRLKQVIADGRSESGSLKIISRAAPPEYSSLPNHSLNLVLAVIIGLGLGALVGVLVELAIWLLPSSTAKPSKSVADEHYLKPSEQY